MSDFAWHRHFKPTEPVPKMDENTGTIDRFRELQCHRSRAGNSIGHHCQLPENPLLSCHNILGTSHSLKLKECQIPAIDLTRVVSDENKGLEKEKKRRYKRKEEDKPKEVIHVRAKRGQATDTHSLAERVRRERINNKLRYLQELVPGCQKTMGLVIMLDEIISYVNSLKNQVEFLSMELEAAYFYQLSRNKRTQKNALETGSHEAQEIEKWAREQF